jgi:hypothetical protein
MRRPIGALGLRLVPLLVLGVATAAAQDLTRTDGQGPVSVTVTLAAASAVGKSLEVEIALNTHSVGLDAIAFDRAVTLRRPDGTETAPSAVQAKGAGHHREAMLSFTPVTQPGSIQILVRDVGGVAERTFTWDLR